MSWVLRERRYTPIRLRNGKMVEVELKRDAACYVPPSPTDRWSVEYDADGNPVRMWWTPPPRDSA